MTQDFDTQLALRGHHVTKYDALQRVFGRDDPDIIPMWVADMDFPAAPPIRAALQAEIDRLTGEGVNKIVLLTHVGLPMDKVLAQVRDKLNKHTSAYPELVLTSSEKGEGIETLRAIIAGID